MEIREALEQLEQLGHRVEYQPTAINDGRRFYEVDGIPRSEDQILKWVIDGTRPGN